MYMFTKQTLGYDEKWTGSSRWDILINGLPRQSKEYNDWSKERKLFTKRNEIWNANDDSLFPTNL